MKLRDYDKTKVKYIKDYQPAQFVDSLSPWESFYGNCLVSIIYDANEIGKIHLHSDPASGDEFILFSPCNELQFILGEQKVSSLSLNGKSLKRYAFMLAGIYSYGLDE